MHRSFERTVYISTHHDYPAVVPVENLPFTPEMWKDLAKALETKLPGRALLCIIDLRNQPVGWHNRKETAHFVALVSKIAQYGRHYNAAVFFVVDDEQQVPISIRAFR